MPTRSCSLSEPICAGGSCYLAPLHDIGPILLRRVRRLLNVSPQLSSKVQVVPRLALTPRSAVSRRCIIMSGVCSTSPAGVALRIRLGAPRRALTARRPLTRAPPRAYRRGDPDLELGAAPRAGMPPTAASITGSRKSWLESSRHGRIHSLRNRGLAVFARLGIPPRIGNT
jgi:hypothetical protein